MRHEPEIVKVLDARRLIDAESYERTVADTPTGALKPGYYVVSWPDDVVSPAYDATARFDGPYPDQARAREALEGLARWRVSAEETARAARPGLTISTAS